MEHRTEQNSSTIIYIITQTRLKVLIFTMLGTEKVGRMEPCTGLAWQFNVIPAPEKPHMECVGGCVGGWGVPIATGKRKEK